MNLVHTRSSRGAAYVGLIGGLLALVLASKASAQGLTAGTVKLLSKNATLVETETSDPFVSLSPTEPAKFLIVGPVKLQADFRVSLPAGQPQGEPVMIDIYAAGKMLRRFKITPKAGTTSWTGKTDVKPSGAVGFYMQIDPGPHAYEVRVTGAPTGAALYLVPDTKAKRRLSANAPVVPPKPPAPVATPAPGGTQIAKATPVPTPKPKSLDEIVTTGRAVDAPMERLSYEVGFKGGVAIPLDDAFNAAPLVGAEARWSLGSGRLFAIGLEVTRTQFGGLDPDDPRRADAPFALNMSLTPVIVNGTFWIPSDGRFRPYVSAGGGIVYTESLYDERNLSVAESTVGPAAQGVVGVQLDLSPTDLREGRQKIFFEVKGMWMESPFEAHDYTDFSTLGVLTGVELKF